MATKDGLAQIWYADANGVITGNTPTADNVASAIIDAYNEHFGTDIQIWTPETKTLQVGDSLPNWNAYEKILLPIVTNVKFKGSSNYYIGKIEQSKCYIYGDGDTKFAVVDAKGYYRALGNDVQGLFRDLIKPALVREGYDVNSYEDIILDLPLNSEVPNFADMVEISL